MEYPDGSELYQCEFCGYVTNWDDIPTARDITGEIVKVCENCNEGESYGRYDPAKAIV